MFPQVQPQLLWSDSGALDVSLSPLNALQLTPPDTTMPCAMMPSTMNTTLPMPDLATMPLPTSGFVSGGSTPTTATTLSQESLRQHGELILANSMAVAKANTAIDTMSARLLQVDESLAKLLKINEQIEKTKAAELRATNKNRAPLRPRPSHPIKQLTPNKKMPRSTKAASSKTPTEKTPDDSKKPSAKMPSTRMPSKMRPYRHAPAPGTDSDSASDVSIRITGVKRPAPRGPPDAPRKGKGPAGRGKITGLKPQIRDFASPPVQTQTQIPRKRPAPPMPTTHRPLKRQRVSRRRKGVDFFGIRAYNASQLATYLTSTSRDEVIDTCGSIKRIMDVIKDLNYLYKRGVSRSGQLEILRDIRRLAPPGTEVYWNQAAARGLATAMAGAIEAISRARRCDLDKRHTLLVKELKHAWPCKQNMLTDTRTARNFETQIWKLMAHIQALAQEHDGSLDRHLEM